MKNKKWLLLLVIAFPSLFWLILETSTINSKKLPYYGPKKTVAGNDTIFHKVAGTFMNYAGGTETLNTDEYPLFTLAFVSSKYRSDAYRLTGLWEYLNYKRSKIMHIPFVLVTETENNNSAAYEELKKLDTYHNIHFHTWQRAGFDSLTRTYFEGKPYYIDYSFFVLVDANRNVRGYYDGRYVSEIKRLIDEYQHLRIKEAKRQVINENEIKTKS